MILFQSIQGNEESPTKINGKLIEHPGALQKLWKLWKSHTGRSETFVMERQTPWIMDSFCARYAKLNIALLGHKMYENPEEDVEVNRARYRIYNRIEPIRQPGWNTINLIHQFK